MPMRIVRCRSGFAVHEYQRRQPTPDVTFSSDNDAFNVDVADVDVDDDDSFRQQSRQKKRLKMIQLWLDQWEEGVHYTSLSLSHSHSFSLYLCHPKNV